MIPLPTTATTEINPLDVLEDREFRRLSEVEQLKALLLLVPEFKTLPDEERLKFIRDPRFIPPPPLTREEVPGELDRLAAGRFAPTPPLPEFVTRPIEAPPPEPQPFVGPQPGPEPDPPEGPPLQVPEIPSSAAPDLGTLALQAAGAGMGPVGAMGAVLRPDLTRIPEMAKAGAENVASLLAETAKMGIVPGGPLPPAMPADTAVGKEGIQEQAAKAAEAYQAPVLPISELTPEPGLSRGIAQGIEQLSSPLNMAIVASLGGVGQVARTAQPIARGVYNLLDTALAGYFGGVMAEAATEEAKAAYRSWKDGDYTAVAEHFGTGSVEALFAALGGARVKSSVTGATKSFQRGYRRGQTRRAKLREEMEKAAQREEAATPPVVPSELPAAEVARPSAPRPVVPVVPPPTAAQPPPVAPPVVPPPRAAVPAVEEAVAPPRPVAEPTPPAKQPWEMTREEFTAGTREELNKWDNSFDEYLATKDADRPGGKTKEQALFEAKQKHEQGRKQLESRRREVEDLHERNIRRAVVEGKPVPPEVLAEYPDLKPPPPAETQAEKARTFDQQMADYGRRLSDTAKSHDVDNLEAIVGEMEEFRNKGGARTDQQIKVLNATIAKSWDTLQSVRRIEQQKAPAPPPAETTGKQAVEEVSDVQSRVGVSDEAEQPKRRTEPESEVVLGPRPPVGRTASGNETEVLVPGEKAGFKARYTVRELSDVHPSHLGATFEPNPTYQIQNERDYGRPENKSRVVRNSNTEIFDPRYLITDNPDAVNGPPVIDPQGNVLGGNSRTMILQRVFPSNPKGTTAYRSMLEAKAQQFGIDPKEMEGMGQPVLVREIPEDVLLSIPHARQRLIRATNKPGTAELAASERATADARQIGPDLADMIAGKVEAAGEDATLRSVLDGPTGVAVVNRLIDAGVFTEQERPRLLDDRTKAVTSDAKDRISKMLLGRFFRDSDQMERTPPSIRNKLERIAAPVMRLEDKADWDILPEIRDAVDLIEYARVHGLKNLRDATSQGSLFGEAPQISSRSVRLAEAINKLGPVQLAKAVRAYTTDSTPTMFEEKGPAEAFDDAFGPSEDVGSESGTLAFKPTGHPSTWPKQRAKADFEAKRTKAAARQAKKKQAAPVDVSTPEAVTAAVGAGTRLRSTDGKIALTAGPDNSIEVKARNRQVQEFLADNQTGLGLRMEREPNGTYHYYLDANEETAGKLSRLMGEHPLAEGAVEGGTGMEAYAPTVAAPERTGAPTMAGSREGQPVVEPIKRVEIIDRFRNDFGKLSIRIGGLIRRGAAAEYHVIAEAIRMKKANDIPSLMHEVGHHVHKLLWGRVGQKLHSAPLQPFADELKPLDYNPSKGRIFEGFAEFVREYVMVPESARKAAPKFYEHFESQLQTRTDLADTLLGSRSDWARWTGQDPIDRLMGSIVVTLPPDQRPWLHVAKDKWDDFYTRWVSSFDPMMEATKAMAKGKDIPVEKHPYYLAQVLSDSAGVAQQYLDSGTFDPITHKPTGESLKTILKRVQDIPISDRIKSKILARIKTDDPKAKFGQFDDRLWALRAYLVAKRVVEKTGEQGIETGIALEDAQATVAELENPTMESVAKDFYDYQNRVLHYAVRRGVMSAEQETKINELNQNYARFSRVMEDEPGRVAAGAQGQGQPVRKMRGSTRDIYDPLEGAIYNTHAIIKWADRQAAVNALIDLAEKSDASGWMVDKYRPKAKAFTFNLQEVKKEIEEIVGQEIDKEDLDIFKTLYRAGTQVPPGKNIISTLRNGKQEFYQLNDLLYRALRPHSEYDSAIVKSALRVMAPPARLLRLGAVGLNPEFTGITNPSRDLLTAFMQSEYGGGDPRKMMDYIHQGEIGKAAEELFGTTIFPRIWYTMQGLKETGQHELHKAFPEKIPDSKQVQEWRSAWGEHAAYFGVDRKHLVDSLKDLMASSPAYAKAHPIEVLRIIGELTENMTRQGEYGLARRKGASPLEAVVKGSRPVTVDFSRAGLVGRVVNQVTAFFNAKVQGTDQFARAHFKRNLPRTMMRGITMITVPALLLQLLNQDDPEYEELPQWQKDWFFMIPTKYFGNETLYNATPFIPLPKPFLWGLIYGTIPERVFQAIVKKDPEASKGILPMILKEAIPNPFGITAAIPIIESWAKKSFFTLQGTEPGYVSTLSKQYRAKGYTTEFSRSLSEFLYDTGMGKTIEEQTGLELTPINIDNLIFGWTGSVGMHVTRIGNIFDPDAPAATLKDVPGIRALAVRSPSSQSDSITKFYDRYEELGQRNKDAQEARKKPEGPTKGAPELTNKEQEELKRLRFFHGKISSRWKNDREIRDDKKLDRDQKRERLDQNTQEMINLAREAIGRRPYGRPTRKP